MSTLFRRVAVLSIGVLALYFGAAPPASAQVTTQYCYQDCFDTLSAAELQMRGAIGGGQHLRKDKSNIWVYGGQDGLRITYVIDNQPPTVFNTPGYTLGSSVQSAPGFCERINDPNLDPYVTFCRYEDELVEKYVAKILADSPNCTITDISKSGAYGEPFVVSTGVFQTYGHLSFQLPQNRFLNYKIGCAGWNDPTPTERRMQLTKMQTYVCPANFYPISGYNPAFNISGNPDNIAIWPKFCVPQTRSADIYVYRNLQTRSAPANCNPCFPATRDKFRREDDLVFAGKPFSRYYHSIGQIQVSRTLPYAWTHSYSDFISYNGEPHLISADGYLESFKSVGTGVYRGLKSNGFLIRLNSDSTWSLDDGRGEVRQYDSAGKLISVRNRVNAAANVDLTYDSGRLLSVADASGRRLTFSYDDDLLVRVALDDGTGVNYTYDSDLNLIKADRGANDYRVYRYHESGLAPASGVHLLTGIEEGTTRYASFGYAANGDVVSSSLHSAQGLVETTTLAYRAGGHVDVVTPNGATRDYTVNTSRYPDIDAITYPDGTESRIYNGDSRLASVTDKRGVTRTYTYDDSLSGDSESSYAIKDASGTVSERNTEITQDAFNRVLKRATRGSSASALRIETYRYDAFGRAIFSCVADAFVSGASDYGCGDSAVAPAGVRQVALTYCDASDVAVPGSTCPIVGLPKSADGPRPGTDAVDTTSFAYYPSDGSGCGSSPTTCPHRKGDLWKVTDALGHVTEMLAYDGAGRPLSTKDANGVVTDYTYHPRGWLTATKVRGANDAVETDDLITAIEYWPTGLVKRVTQPDGAFTRFTYDAAHRLTDIADNAGGTLHYTLDNAGNRLKEDTRDAGGNLKRTLARVFDQLGRMQTQADADANPTDFTYDANGNAETVTDALGHVTDHDYDPLNRLKRTLQDVGGIGAETRFEYDALDNLTQVTDPKGLATTYTYNGLGDLTQLVSPDTGTSSYTYDSAGNRKTQTDARGVTTIYGYDALNRLTSVGYSTDSAYDATYTYDTVPADCASGETFAQGRLAQLQNGNGATLKYCYDRFGSMVRKVQTVNGKTQTLRYAYTAGGHLQAVTYPDGMVVDYGRDTNGRIDAVGVTPAGGSRQTLISAVAYAPMGPPSSWTYGNGRVLDRAHDQNYWPTAVQDTAPGGLSLGFGYDAAGRLDALHEPADPSVKRLGYGYDALGRLTQTRDGPSGTPIETYTYDATGNRTSFGNSAGTTAYAYPGNSHRLSSVGAAVRGYDAAGNTTTVNGKTFVYTPAGRMGEVQSGGATTMAYAYNGLGEQVRRDPGAASTSQEYFVYDEAGHWIGTYDSAGAMKQQFIWADDLPVGLIDAGGVKYIEPDHLGTPRAVIDPVRNVAVWTWDAKSEAFGNSVPNQNPDGDAFAFEFDMRFPGQRYDSMTGMYYNYFRDYDAGTARYSQSDPIGLAGGINTYGYAQARPVNLSDRIGLQSRDSDYISRDAKTYLRTPPSVAEANLIGWALEEAFCSFCDLNYGGEGLQSVAAPWEILIPSRGILVATERAAVEAAMCPIERGAARIPSAWGKGLANRKGVGRRWFDPANEGNGVRIDAGNPSHAYPSQQVDHVIVRSGGSILDSSGQPISGSLKSNPQAHISLEDWMQWAEWNRP